MFRYFLFQLLRVFVQTIPPRITYIVGAVLAEVFYVFSRRSKPNFRANLLHVLKYMGKDVQSRESRKKVRRLVRKNFRNFSYYLVDFFRFSRLQARHVTDLVEVVGTENIDRSRARGKGTVGVTAHVGNWELGGIVFSRLGYPINAIALSHHNTKINRLFVHQRALGGIKVIPVGEAAVKSLRALKKNEVVVILGDRDVTERGVKMNFFGAPVSLPRGPAALAGRSGADIFFGYFIRQSTHRYKVVFNPILEVDRSIPVDEQKRWIMKELIRQMEQCIMENLSQWYMYYRIWPDEEGG